MSLLTLTLLDGSKVYCVVDKISSFCEDVDKRAKTVIYLNDSTILKVQEPLEEVHKQYQEATVRSRIPSALAVAGDILAAMHANTRTHLDSRTAALHALEQARTLFVEYGKQT